MFYQGSLYLSNLGEVSLMRLDDTGWVNLCENCNISSMYVYGDKLLLGGLYGNPNDVNPTPLSQYGRFLIQFDGANFSSFKGVDSLAYGVSVYTMNEYKGELYVAGKITHYLSQYLDYNDIIRWDGQHWKSLGNGLQGGGLAFINDLEVLDDTLYVGGYFRKYAGSPGNCIAKWDGNNWHDVPPGVIDGGGVTELQAYKGGLFVTTTSDHLGNDYSSRVAYYKNGRWCYNTETINNQSFAAVDFFGKLLIGGGYTKVGNTSCSYLLQLLSEGDCITSGIAEAKEPVRGWQVYPNPVNDKVRVELPNWKEVQLQIISLTGQVLYTQTIDVTKNNTAIELDLQHFNAGFFILRMNSNDGNSMQQKIIKN